MAQWQRNENRTNVMTCEIRQESQTKNNKHLHSKRFAHRRQQRQRQRRRVAPHRSGGQNSGEQSDLSAKLASVRFLRPFRSVLFLATRGLFQRRILRCEKNIRDWARYDQKKNLQQLNPVSPTAARTAECFARSRRRNLKYKFKFLRVVKSSIKNRTRETDNRSETLSINTPDCDILTN